MTVPSKVSLINNAQNGAGFWVLQRVIPQPVIVFSHGIAFGVTGVMAVFNQADSNTCGFCAHFRTIAVHAVEQMPFIAPSASGAINAPPLLSV